MEKADSRFILRFEEKLVFNTEIENELELQLTENS